MNVFRFRAWILSALPWPLSQTHIQTHTTRDTLMHWAKSYTEIINLIESIEHKQFALFHSVHLYICAVVEWKFSFSFLRFSAASKVAANGQLTWTIQLFVEIKTIWPGWSEERISFEAYQLHQCHDGGGCGAKIGTKWLNNSNQIVAVSIGPPPNASHSLNFVCTRVCVCCSIGG